jgi:glucose/arabinose dehydrogenase/PKD repeat protein
MNKLSRYCLFILFSIVFTHTLVFAQQPPTGFSTVTVGNNWEQPVGLTFTSDGRLIVWEKAGKIWMVENNIKSLKLDISEEVGNWNDHGLLGFALDPRFQTNGYVYLLYAVDRHHLMKFGTSSYNQTSNEYNKATIGRLTRYTARPSDGTIDPASRKVLLGESISTGIPILATSHGVGSLVFGSDGTLMVSCGDGGNATTLDGGSTQDSYFRQALDDQIISTPQNIGAFRAQQVDALNGKVLRLDPATGDGVPSNPFFDAANPRAPRSRVWAMGLRNPFRMVKRPDTGSPDPAQGNPGVFYLGDVGWGSWEEMNVVNKPGLNFGWPLFEGLERNPDYNTIRRPNRFFPNPFYQQNGCTEQYYSFSDLLKQATLDPSVVFTNNCNGAGSAPIPTNIPQFFHARPMFDWRTNRASRTGSFVRNEASVDTIGRRSPVEGSAFGGNCSVAGVWYTGTSFPSNYQHGYFHADYGQGWIRFFHIDGLDRPLKVQRFVDSRANVTAMAVDPVSGALYYVHLGATAPFAQEVRKISYEVNTVPAAVATADKTYGPGPLTVKFSSVASSDPQGRPLTYEWNFGDNTARSTAANPVHVFEAPGNTPVAYTVTLKVTNDLGKFSTAVLRISLNNTPPSVAISSLPSTSTYPLTVDTTVPLTASVSDTEQGEAGLRYAWQVTLHHNNHVHQEPIDANRITSATISPVGCNGEEYYYSITLTVTDDLGLSASDQVILLPNCLPDFNVSNLSASAFNTRVILAWNLPSQAVDEIMVVAKAGKSIGKIPLQEGASYTANPSFSGKGTAFDSGKVVFKGQSASTSTVYDLSTGERYYFRVFSRVGNQWSTGSEIDATPSLITSVEEPGDKRMELFPNPANETFSVRISGYPQLGQAQFRLLNQTGQSVLEQTEVHVEGTDHLLSVQQLPSGLYFLQIRVGSEWAYKKVLIRR